MILPVADFYAALQRHRGAAPLADFLSALNTIGGVVTPAQILMAIVPAETHLEIEAMVANKDIGFVEAGQDAAIKVDTFNFTRYGLLHGKVVNVSSDAITRDTPTNKSQPSDAAASGSPDLVYAARVSLDHSSMQVEGKQISLAPGMSVVVEIKTGTRSVISYVLSPLIRYQHDSLRER